VLFNRGVSQTLPSSRGKPFQSKLEPVAEIIRDLRRHRKSYRQIAQVLRDEHGILVDRSTIWNYVKVRSKPRRDFAMLEDPSAISRTAANSRSAIELLKAKPLPPAKKPIFTFDENKPLTLITEQS
jgi:IS30 family transposase